MTATNNNIETLLGAIEHRLSYSPAFFVDMGEWRGYRDGVKAALGEVLGELMGVTLPETERTELGLLRATVADLSIFLTDGETITERLMRANDQQVKYASLLRQERATNTMLISKLHTKDVAIEILQGRIKELGGF